MPETDRVATPISDFLASDNPEKIEALSEVVQHTVIDGYRRFMELQMEDEVLKKSFTDIQESLGELIESPPADADLPGAFEALMLRAMVARRATYDLTNPDRPCEQLSAEVAMADEDDMMAFMIVDTVVDKIADLINPPDPEDKPAPPTPASEAVVESYKKQMEKEEADRAERIAKAKAESNKAETLIEEVLEAAEAAADNTVDA